MNKYRNEKYRGFDSKKEARRYDELYLLERCGEIKNLRSQVEYELIPRQMEGKRVAERAVKYIADFVYEVDGEVVVEDVKSEITRKNPDYIIKRKLMLWVHHIKIHEV